MTNVQMSDEVLHYMAEHLAEAPATQHPDLALPLILMVIAKAELYNRNSGWITHRR